MKRILYPLLYALAGALAAYVVLPAPAIPYPDVIVLPHVIRAREPDTVVRWRERILTATPAPVVVAVAPGGAVAEVARFCAQSVQPTVQPAAKPVLLLRSVTTHPSWLGRDRVLFTGPLSDGDLWAGDFRGWPGWSARTVGDGILFREPRFGFARRGLELVIPAVAGWVIGRIM